MTASTTRKAKPLALCLLGPTACGKTALAVELVQREPFEIINVDSAQIYRGMDIGTGKPDADTLRRAPHRLLDFLDPSCSYSASRFCEDALREMHDIHCQGRVPLLVGGTMLYFKALRDGLAPMPPADPEVRERIEAQAEHEGWASIHEQLRLVDPVAAARIHPNDPQRLQRALEVYLVSGETLTSWHKSPQATAEEFPFRLKFIGLQPVQRHSLHERIALRFHAMIAAGLIEEVRTLYDRGDLSLGLPSMRSVGYRQVWQYLAGEMPYEAVTEKGIIATRQLAKRQLTWMRSWPDLHNFDSEDSKILDRVLNFYRLDSI